ncbi:tetraacyldisaccharide 4'-kinase [Ramlibacter tataouinensis]|uniref:Tetraacyldisaccharide 4'-kinase n=1 Tax=Ramlibacter tataouinensis (strain ATCC BAA-407 / DSM 14655 / LMG 21543 / TTB310) TaxID=365046 RepID=F5XZS7_RAMTT|nr:tetraacyldisaccharide 4'-kinase [Ramlibacter tataouinensis]AEG93288.1 Candidate Tetraacyldisaccharide 4-kinase [Ramlibacter tataouinensis TTB310]
MAAAALQRAWRGRGPLACLLWPLSLLFGMLAALRRAAYRRGWRRTEDAGIPVIVIGNVLTGGAGKTPVVMAVVEHLRAAGLRPGVISRGYGRHSRGTREVHADSPPGEVGDEPLLIARRCGVPVFVAERRMAAARALRAAHPATQVLVCDDGLQHLGLARDVEVCVFDERGTGNGWLLPAGPLRERWPRPVDLVLRPAGVPIEGFGLQRRLADEAVRADGTRRPLEALRETPCIALAGIAKPEAFFAMLRERGLAPVRTVALPDHDDFAGWQPGAHAGHSLLCTEKDAVKLWRHRPDAWAVPLALAIEPAFWSRLDSLLAPKLSSPHGSQTA